MATLKISDLSVDDWVRCEGKIYQLTSISNDGEVELEFDDEYNYRCRGAGIEDIKPIPITAEMLKKNGLEYIDDVNDAVEFLCCDMFWARLCVGDTFWQVGIHSEDKLDAVVCNIKHVHQLQHALHLAGVCKEINL